MEKFEKLSDTRVSMLGGDEEIQGQEDWEYSY